MPVQPLLPLPQVRVMNASPLPLGVLGPAIAAQNCGFDVHVAPPAGATITDAVDGPRLLALPVLAAVPRFSAPGGSLP